jgi:hypothetical protein
VPGVEQEALLWVSGFRANLEPISDEFLSSLRDGWLSFYDRKVGQEIPAITQEDHSVLEQITNIPKPAPNHKFNPPFQDIDQGMNTRLEAGKFYWQPQTGFVYYCASIETVGAALYMVEAYDAKGEIVRSGRFYVTPRLFNCFVEMTDESRIPRLIGLYEELMRMEKSRGF